MTEFAGDVQAVVNIAIVFVPLYLILLVIFRNKTNRKELALKGTLFSFIALMILTLLFICYITIS